MNDVLKVRLGSRRFADAVDALEGERQEDQNLVWALARMFGNIGMTGGDIDIIIGAAIEGLLLQPLKDV